MPVWAETLVLDNGRAISGRIGDLKANIVKFYGEGGYFTYKLDRIRDFTIDQDLSPEQKIKQQENVRRLRKVIDKEKFLIADFEKKVSGLFMNKKYSQLDDLATQLIEKKERFPSGLLKIAFLYDALRPASKSDGEYQKHLLLVDDWMSTTKSETSQVASIYLANRYAWLKRGGGYSNTTTKKGRRQFSSIMQKNVEAGELLRQEYTSDVTLFSKLINAHLAVGTDKRYIKKLAIEAARIDPYYYRLHSVMINALLPRWGGSYEEVKTYIQRLAAKYGRDGLGHEDLYFRLIRLTYEKMNDDEFSRYQFNWSRIQRSFAVYEKNYPINEYDYHLMARLSGLFGDRESTKKFLSSTTQQWNFLSKRLWKKKSILQQFSEWAYQPLTPEFSDILTTFLSNKLPLNIEDILRIYIASGGDINRGDVYGNTLLHHAVKNNNLLLSHLLLKLGADVNQRNTLFRTPLYSAAWRNRSALVDVFLSESQVDESNVKHAFFISAKYGFNSQVQSFLKHTPALLNTVNNSGFTALALAASKGHVDTVKLLLNYDDVNLEVMNNAGSSVLHLAVVNNHQELVELLAQAGANVNIENKYHYTPLNLAEQEGLNPLAQYLRSVGGVSNKDIISLKDRREAKALYDQASPYFQSDSYQKAIPLLVQSIAKNPLDGLSHHGLAVIYLYHAKEYALAKEHILRSIELSPNDTESYYTAGRVYYAMGEIDQSKPFFQKYVKLAPDTYNTQDLKNNYAFLLDINDKSSPLEGATLSHQVKRLLVENRQFLMAGFSILLLILVMIRLRRKKSQHNS